MDVFCTAFLPPPQEDKSRGFFPTQNHTHGKPSESLRPASVRAFAAQLERDMMAEEARRPAGVPSASMPPIRDIRKKAAARRAAAAELKRPRVAYQWCSMTRGLTPEAQAMSTSNAQRKTDKQAANQQQDGAQQPAAGSPRPPVQARVRWSIIKLDHNVRQSMRPTNRRLGKSVPSQLIGVRKT